MFEFSLNHTEKVIEFEVILKRLILLNLFFIFLINTHPIQAYEMKSEVANWATEVPYLSHEEFVNLYEADQLKYIKLMQKAAVELSFRSDYVAQQNWPWFFNIFQALQTNAMASGMSEIQLRENLANLVRRATALQNERPKRPTTGIGHYFSNWLGTADIATGRKEHRKKVIGLFEQRNTLLRNLNGMSPEIQHDSMAALNATHSAFATLLQQTSDIWNDDEGKTELQEIQNRYNRTYQVVLTSSRTANPALLAAFNRDRLRMAELNRPAAVVRPIPPLTRREIVAPRDLTVRDSQRQPVVTTTEESTATRSCAKCIYGGFAIVNQSRCESVNSLTDPKHNLSQLVLPSSITNRSLTCENEDAPVLCNPLVFGFKDNGPLCVRKSSSATRACASTSNKDSASITSIRDLILDNRELFLSFNSELRSICQQSSCSRNSSAARRTDISNTCIALREQLISFRESMRSLPPRSPTPSTGDVPTSPAPTPTPVSPSRNQ